MAYTTAAKVRMEAGLVNNHNLKDTTHFAPVIDEAHAELQGRISSRYVLTAFNSNFTGSQAEDLLGRIETLLAAGYILQREYPQEEGEGSEGDMRLKRAMDLIDSILGGKLKLIDANGQEFALLGSGRSGLSINSTLPAFDDTERPGNFTMNDVF